MQLPPICNVPPHLQQLHVLGLAVFDWILQLVPRAQSMSWQVHASVTFVLPSVDVQSAENAGMALQRERRMVIFVMVGRRIAGCPSYSSLSLPHIQSHTLTHTFLAKSDKIGSDINRIAQTNAGKFEVWHTSSQVSKYIYTFENHDVLGNVPL